MSTITLRTGQTTFIPLLKAVKMSFEHLFQTKVIVAYELVMLCRDPNHKLFGDCGQDLAALQLVEKNPPGGGRIYWVRDQVRDIVLAMVEGEGLDMQLVNPVGVQTETMPVVTTKTARLDDYKLYCAARRIADIICETGIKCGCSFVDWRKEDSNPFYNQTASGFFIEFYYSKPGTLWTPWGKWGFTGSSSGNWEKAWNEVSTSLGATLYKPEETSTMGTFGPVFAVHKLDGGNLPKPAELAKTSYDSYEKVNKAWKKLTEQYMASK